MLLLGGLLFLSEYSVAQETSAPETADNLAVDSVAVMEPGAMFDVKRSLSTGSVSTVKGSTLYQTPAANLTNTLYGRLPGLMVLQGSGEPGNDAASLRIRGAGTFNDPGMAIFIDGFQTNFDFLQNMIPGEIESISVLKDAAAVAPFGMKGGNGVLWITTRRGEIGKPKIQLQARTGFQNPTVINKPLNSYGYASLYNEAVSNDNGRVWSPVYTDALLQEYQNGSGTDVDWFNEVLRENAPYTDADVTFSGGDLSTKYFVLLGYMKKQGLYNVTTDDLHSNAEHQRLNIRTNLDFKLFEIFEGSVNLGGRIEDRRNPGYSTAALWNNLARYPSNIYPVTNPNGSWTGTQIYPDNPLASISDLGYISTHDRTLQANFNLKEKLDFLAEGLYLTQGVSFNNWNRGTYGKTKNYARYIGDVPQTTDQHTNYSVFDDDGTNQWDWIQLTGSLGYQKQFGNNTFTGAVNYLQYTYKVDANQNGAAGINTTYGYQNIGGRLNYAINDRYVAEFGFAYSGSDNYAKENRFGFYPTVSAAWIISNESFFSNSENIDYLKLRASAGRSGNDQFSRGRYLYQGYYVNAASYNTGVGDLQGRTGLIQPYVPNPEIFAEQSTKYNIGLETKLFDRFDLSVDAFVDKRTDIITQDFTLSAVFGAAPPYRNIGEVTNKGFEASLEYHNRAGALEYFITGFASYNSNTIDYMAEVITVPNASQTGNPIGTPLGLETIGFYDISDFDADGTLRDDLPAPDFGAVQPGDIKYKNVNGDNRIDQQDEGVIGNTYLPKMTYAMSLGLTYGGFDLQLLLQGAGGRSVNLLHVPNQTMAFVNNGNAYEIAQGRWAYYPDQGIDTRASATYPRLTTEGNNNNYRNSTFWMRNGNFLRLRNVEIGYTLPASLTNKLSVPKARIFVNAVSMLTWSPLMKDLNMDPETLAGYPALKSIMGGITVNF